MPIRTEQHDARRLLIAVASERVTLRDLLAMLAEQTSGRIPSDYSLLLDARDATVALDPTEVRLLADAVTRRKQLEDRGSIAIVVSASHVVNLARMYQSICEMVGRDTSVQTFRSRPDAEAWLAGNPRSPHSDSGS
jgi:hypothetical protein